jgi:hypothetical protein
MNSFMGTIIGILFFILFGLLSAFFAGEDVGQVEFFEKSEISGVCYEVREVRIFFAASAAMSPVDDAFCEDNDD